MRRDTKQLYAMKVLDKEAILGKSMELNVINERKILATLDFPLIVNLHCGLQNEFDLFMVVDLMQGGDLRYHMKQDREGISNERILFYVAQISLALDYLHKRGYVHRDVKPDNILLDSDGNCHLTDFNLSTALPKDGLRGTAGTKPYMGKSFTNGSVLTLEAPEILAKEAPYGFPVDYWALGVCAFELAFNKVSIY